MIKDRQDVLAIVSRIAEATTEGSAMAEIPDEWAMFVVGPDTTEAESSRCSASIVPGAWMPMATRLYQRGLATGRGMTRLEALRAAARWIEERSEAVREHAPEMA